MPESVIFGNLRLCMSVSTRLAGTLAQTEKCGLEAILFSLGSTVHA
jgi:hypothetical protein